MVQKERAYAQCLIKRMLGTSPFFVEIMSGADGRIFSAECFYEFE